MQDFLIASTQNGFHCFENGKQIAFFKSPVQLSNTLKSQGRTQSFSCHLHNSMMHLLNKSPLCHQFSYQKETPIEKCMMPEKMTSFVASNDGSLLAAGSVTGNIYLWQANTGTLLNIFEAHFKSVTHLLFACPRYLISAGEDAILHVWSISDLITQKTITPLFSFSEHSLPITSLFVGLSGSNGDARFLSASRDKTLKFWDLKSRKCLRTIVLPSIPTKVISDLQETRVFAGCENGLIYFIPLFPTATSSIPEIFHLNQEQQMIFTGHTAPIRALELSWDTTKLYSGCDQGQLKLWDVSTRQNLSTFSQLEVKIILKPEYFLIKDPKGGPLPVQLKKLPNQLPETIMSHQPTIPSNYGFSNNNSEAEKENIVNQSIQNHEQNDLQNELEEARKEIKRLKEENSELSKLNDEMYQNLISQQAIS